MVTLESGIPALPSPPNGDYSLELLSAFGSILLIVIGFLVREYLRRESAERAYREKREADDIAFRDKQLEKQEQHYKDVSASRDQFRANYDAHTNERLDGFERTIEAFHSKVLEIMDRQQGQISGIDKELHGLMKVLQSQNGQQKPPKEGG